MNSPNAIATSSLEREITPIAKSLAFTEPASGAARIAFREGKVAGARTAELLEELGIDVPLEEVVVRSRAHREYSKRVMDSDEFAVGSMLSAYQARQAAKREQEREQA
jgi:hypothetical protein